MKLKYQCILFILLCTFSCCKKNNTSPNAFTKASYPLAVGNWWQYQFIDYYLGGATDTFLIRVDSMANDGPYIKYICNYVDNGTIIPAGYFLQSDTSMSFVQPYGYHTSFPNFHFKFPIEAGQKWPGAFPGDTTVVVAVVSSEEFYGHTYGPCYSTTESYNLPHNFKAASMTLTPKIGLIQQAITFNSDTAGVQIQQQVNLIDYHVQ